MRAAFVSGPDESDPEARVDSPEPNEDAAPSGDPAEIERQLPPGIVDEFIDSYVWWREECAAVRDAYERWASSSPPDRELAHAAYRAALDREESAARVQSGRAERVLIAAGDATCPKAGAR